jgi:hypothetical protein
MLTLIAPLMESTVEIQENAGDSRKTLKLSRYQHLALCVCQAINVRVGSWGGCCCVCVTVN